MNENPKSQSLIGQFLNPVLRGIGSLYPKKSDPIILFEGDSDFHHITVIELEGIRTLCLGPEAQEAETSMSINAPLAPIFEYPGLMLMALALCPLNKDILMLGLGGGFIPNLFQKHLSAHHLTVVEVDPLIAELAETYFGFSATNNIELVIADGLEFIASSNLKKYDQIWLDAFCGFYIPPHLATMEFLEITRLHIKEGGFLVQNLHQTKLFQYHTQLANTKMVFQHEPLIFGGQRCANSVIFSLNHSEKKLPYHKKEIIKLAKEFGPKIGPYNLLAEAEKILSFSL
jgi:spermidine synthase